MASTIWPRYTFMDTADRSGPPGLGQNTPPTTCKLCHLTFSNGQDHINHIACSPLHFNCEYCIKFPSFLHVEEFESAEALQAHQRHLHGYLYCEHCDKFLATDEERLDHLMNQHSHICFLCGIEAIFPTPELLGEHCRTDEHLRREYTRAYASAPRMPPPPAPEPPAELKFEEVGNHYATLRISRYSTHEEVIRAAKEMRIKTHPDRLKREVGLTKEQKRAIDVEAALVGQAADVLSDPTLRREYDRMI